MIEEAGIKILFLDALEVEDITFKNTLLELYGDEIIYKTQFEDAFSFYMADASSYDLLILSCAKEKEISLGIVRQFLSHNTGLKVVVISNFESKESVFEIIESGVDRVLLHPSKSENIKTNIHIVVEYIEQIKRLNILNTDARRCKRVANEYKKAVDASSIFSISDLSGRIVYANRQFVKISGYTLEELRDKPHSIVRHPDTESAVFKELWETIQNKEIWKGIIKNRSKDGNPYYVNATIVPILGRDNNIVEYAGIRHEITELVNKTTELEELKNKQRVEDIQKALKIRVDEILDAIPYPAIFIDENSSKVLNKNELFRSIFANHKIFKLKEFGIGDLFEKQDGYLYLNENFTFYDSYELCDEDDRVVLVDFDGAIKEFFIAARQKENGIIIVLVPKR